MNKIKKRNRTTKKMNTRTQENQITVELSLLVWNGIVMLVMLQFAFVDFFDFFNSSQTATAGVVARSEDMTHVGNQNNQDNQRKTHRETRK